jgi:hypothetical protein
MISELMAQLDSKLGTISKETIKTEKIDKIEKMETSEKPEKPEKQEKQEKPDATTKIIQIKDKSTPQQQLETEQKAVLSTFSETDQARLKQLPQKELSKLLSIDPKVLKVLVPMPNQPYLKRVSAMPHDQLERLIAFSTEVQKFILETTSNVIKKLILLSQADLQKLMSLNFQTSQLKKVFQFDKFQISKVLSWSTDNNALKEFILRAARFSSTQKKRLFQLEQPCIDQLIQYPESVSTKILTLSVKTIPKLMKVDADTLSKVFVRANIFNRRKQKKEEHEKEDEDGDGDNDNDDDEENNNGKRRQKKKQTRQKKVVNYDATFANYKKRMVDLLKEENSAEYSQFDNSFLSDFGISDAEKKGVKKSAHVLKEMLEAKGIKIRGLADENKKEGAYAALPGTTDVRIEQGGTAKVIYVGPAYSFPGANKKASKYALTKKDYVYEKIEKPAKIEKKEKKEEVVIRPKKTQVPADDDDEDRNEDDNDDDEKEEEVVRKIIKTKKVIKTNAEEKGAKKTTNAPAKKPQVVSKVKVKGTEEGKKQQQNKITTGTKNVKSNAKSNEVKQVLSKKTTNVVSKKSTSNALPIKKNMMVSKKVLKKKQEVEEEEQDPAEVSVENQEEDDPNEEDDSDVQKDEDEDDDEEEEEEDDDEEEEEEEEDE